MGKPHVNVYPRKESRRAGVATLPHRLPVQDHRQLGYQLTEVQVTLAAIADTLAAAYGKSAEVTKYAAKLVDSCNTLRGKLGRELDSEHPLVNVAVRQGCYPVPHSTPAKEQGA
jgi:hypothetical protein